VSEDAEDWAAELEADWDPEPAHLEDLRAIADDDSETVYLWSENKPAFEVFVQCKWQVVINPDGKKEFMGITAQELQAACWLCAITDAQRADAVQGVRTCEDTALPYLNRDR